MRIALLQLNARLGDPEGNGRKLQAAYAEAIRSGADLALAPELAIPGYLLEDRLWEPGMRRRIEGESMRLAALSGPVPLVFGTARPAPSGRQSDQVASSTVTTRNVCMPPSSSRMVTYSPG